MYEVLIGEKKYEVVVVLWVAGKPAQLYGPPEDCYPEEDMELVWEACTGDDHTNFLIDNLDDMEIGLIEDQLVDMLTGQDYDGE